MSRISFRLIPDKEKEETGRLWNLSNKQADFVSMATHQIKTPLAGIKWTLRMLLDGDAGELNTEQREWLEKSFESNMVPHILFTPLRIFLLNLAVIPSESLYAFSMTSFSFLKSTPMIRKFFDPIISMYNTVGQQINEGDE